MIIKDIVRDATFIFFMQFWAGIVIALLGFGTLPSIIMAVSYIISLISFGLIIHWTLAKKAQHLMTVTFLFWGVSYIFETNIADWLISGAMIFSAAFIALGISRCFQKSV